MMFILSLAVIFFVVKIGLLNKQNYIVKKFVEKKVLLQCLYAGKDIFTLYPYIRHFLVLSFSFLTPRVMEGNRHRKTTYAVFVGRLGKISYWSYSAPVK